MKKWLVHASCMVFYTIEINAETEEKALEIADETDGGAWKELDDRGDWEIDTKMVKCISESKNS